MGFKFGDIEIDTDYSSSETSLASSSSDEEKKMAKKASKGKDHKYRPDKVDAYESIIGQPTYRKKGDDRKKTRFLPPPDEPNDTEYKPLPKDIPKDVGRLDGKSVRDALLKYVQSQSCWRTGAAESMELSDLKLNSAIVYRCEMFVEERKVKWKSTGYKKGDSIDPPKAGSAPMPWELEMKPSNQWKEDKLKKEVPHTCSVRKCWYCKGKGKVRCRECKGKEFFACDHCSGSGEQEGPEGPQPCGICSGSGQRACGRCHGHGNYKCKTCDGHKKLKWYVQNQTKWETHSEDKIHEETALPDHLVSEVKGQEVYCDENAVLVPLSDFPEEHIQKFSKELLPAMIAKYKKDGRILAMRHKVLVTPVTEVSWKFDGHGGKFFVYGLDRKVYFPDYPQQCCCSLL
ncbi:hypothetical protein BOX15_Mlig027209g2 [Macrostomum lignano]|uniref:Protein SSUH2 homolog n=1 Tax=Macrostomum lignano TaxID=282301 RepID=A0A267DKJ1_9PLAT|nr:hypothetical protein BOX15_Mlig027209g3 [Macrostomum lignano]PAA85571.1 hypothetical protein BOX15_Mlig027209g2 [Macrostomum lignano]